MRDGMRWDERWDEMIFKIPSKPSHSIIPQFLWRPLSSRSGSIPLMPFSTVAGGSHCPQLLWAELLERVPGSGVPSRRVLCPFPAEMKMYSLAVTPNGHLEGRGAVPPPIIMRTAATPMPTPKCSPHLDSLHALGDSRRGSNASLDPTGYDQKSLVGSCGRQLPLK